MSTKNMGIALMCVALIAAAVALEINGKQSAGLWVLVVLLVMFADWEAMPNTVQNAESTVSVLDAWEAIGHDAGVNPSKEELLDSLRNMSHLVEILSTATNPAVDQVLAERIRQIQKHGYGGDHDDEHDKGELLDASICYAIEAQVVTDDSSHISSFVPTQWPWHAESWKPGTPHRMLVKALALGLAELERQNRAEQHATEAPSND